MDVYEKMLIDNKPIQCEQCNERIFYVGNGKYCCKSCGKIKEDFLFEHREFEISEDSRYFLKCGKCGCSIREGRFCPYCVRELSGGIKRLFAEDSGRRYMGSAMR